MAEPSAGAADDGEVLGPLPYEATALVTYVLRGPLDAAGLELGSLQSRWDRDVEYQDTAFASKPHRHLLEGLRTGKTPGGWSDEVFSGMSKDVLNVLSNRTHLAVRQFRVFVENYNRVEMPARCKALAKMIVILEDTKSVLSEFKYFDAANRMIGMRNAVQRALSDAEAFRSKGGPAIDGPEIFLADKNLDDEGVVSGLDDAADAFEKKFMRKYNEDIVKGLEEGRRDLLKMRAEFDEWTRALSASSDNTEPSFRTPPTSPAKPSTSSLLPVPPSHRPRPSYATCPICNERYDERDGHECEGAASKKQRN